jgi:hypothetical protein
MSAARLRSKQWLRVGLLRVIWMLGPLPLPTPARGADREAWTGTRAVKARQHRLIDLAHTEQQFSVGRALFIDRT